jgi:hypothetical protein
MSRAFPERSDCIVPSIPAVSGSLVSSCLIENPPPPTFIIDPPFVPPTTFDFGCYETKLLTSVTGIIYTDTAPLPTNLVNANVFYPHFDETGVCEPNIDIDFKVPCTAISQKGNITFFPANVPPAYLVTSSRNSEVCEHTFDVNLNIPCPEITGSISVHTAFLMSTSGKIEVSQSATPNGCAFNLDLDINVQCPTFYNSTGPNVKWDHPNAIVPSLSVTVKPVIVILPSSNEAECIYQVDSQLDLACGEFIPDLNVTYNNNFTAFNVTPVNPVGAYCEYLFEVVLGISCPTFTTTPIIERGPALDATLTIDNQNPLDPTGCNYDVFMDLVIPCPVLNGSTRTPTFTTTNPPEIKLEITPTVQAGTDVCVFDIVPSLRLRCDEFPSPTLNIIEYPLKSNINGQVTVIPTATPSNCTYELNVTLSTPSTVKSSDLDMICDLEIDINCMLVVYYRTLRFRAGFLSEVTECNNNDVPGLSLCCCSSAI